MHLSFIQTIQHIYDDNSNHISFCFVFPFSLPLSHFSQFIYTVVKKATTNVTHAWWPYTASYTECLVHIGLTLETLQYEGQCIIQTACMRDSTGFSGLCPWDSSHSVCMYVQSTGRMVTYRFIVAQCMHIPVVCKLIVEQQHNSLHSYVMDGQQCILVVTSLKFKVQDQLPCQNVIHSLRVQPHLISQLEYIL